MRAMAFGSIPTTTEFDTAIAEAGPGSRAGPIPTRSRTTCSSSSSRVRPTSGRACRTCDRRIDVGADPSDSPGNVGRRARATAPSNRSTSSRRADAVSTGVCPAERSGGSCAGARRAHAALHERSRTSRSVRPVQNAQRRLGRGPTPDAINKAVDAGRRPPLYALTNTVPGAYPVVWVDHLYAPAHGLSVEKTEGLATLIRYLATTGQEKETGRGRGPPVGTARRQGARRRGPLVMSNCAGSDRPWSCDESDPGPLAPPATTAMKSIGTMLHCEAASAHHDHARRRRARHRGDDRAGHGSVGDFGTDSGSRRRYGCDLGPASGSSRYHGSARPSTSGRLPEAIAGAAT